MYQPRRNPRNRFVRVRNLDYHVLEWGQPQAGEAPLLLVHGWMDVAASWQFVVDAFEREHHVIAPDWRGYGLTQGPTVDNYWFPDYMADLDFLVDQFSPAEPVNLVGHSMGGHVAMQYAGIRPARIRRLVNLEGFGGAASQAEQAPRRYAKWMDELKAFHRGEMDLKTYGDAAGVAGRLMKTNRRLDTAKADWLATHWARQDTAGTWRILGDAAHKLTNAQLFRVDEVLAIYKSITAPTLSVEASDDSLSLWWQGRYTLGEYHQRLQCVADCRTARIEDAGHMMHHDQPAEVARLIESFIA